MWRFLVPSVIPLMVTPACQSDGGGSADAGGQYDASADVDAGADAPVLRIATVNTRCLVDDWERRKPILVDELAALRPDVIAIQEICRGDGEDSLGQLLDGLEASTGVAYSSARAETHLAWDEFQEGIALASRLPLRVEAVLALPEGAFGRKAIVARIDSELGPVTFAATHLSYGDQEAVRVSQLAAIRDAIEIYHRPDDLVVVAGDLNEGPEGAAVGATLEAGYLDTWAEHHPGDPGLTHPADAPTARIDHILVDRSSSPAVQVVGVEHFLTTEVGGVRASDHLGVWADLGL